MKVLVAGATGAIDGFRTGLSGRADPSPLTPAPGEPMHPTPRSDGGRGLTRRWLGIGLAVLALGCSRAGGHVDDRPAAQQARSVDTPLHAETYRSRVLSAHPRLVVVLHGDAPFNDPDYHYVLARRISEENDDVVAVALLRPGYADPRGNRSPGERGHAVGDNYTPEVVQAVAESVRRLRRAHEPGRVLVVGHSGGAVVAANLLGLAPGLVDGAALVSCPCDVQRFRAHMGAMRDDPRWRRRWASPVRSISPVDLVSDVDAATRIVLIVGEDDDVAPPALTRAYAALLKERSIEADVHVLEGRGHELFLDRAVRSAVSRLLDE